MIRLLPFTKRPTGLQYCPCVLFQYGFSQVVIRMVIRIISFGSLIRHTLQELIKLNPGFLRTLRGLRGTAPYHWDGVPGDPYGGLNASTKEYLEPNSDPDKPERRGQTVIDSSMSSTMISMAVNGRMTKVRKGIWMEPNAMQWPLSC